MLSQTQATSARADYARTLEGMLTARVAVEAQRCAGVHRFERFASAHVDVLVTAGDPMRVVNGPSDSTSAYLYRLVRGHCRMTHAHGALELASGGFVAFRGSRELEIVHHQPYEIRGVRLSESCLRRWLPDWTLAEFSPLHERCAEAQLLFQMADSLLDTGPRLDARSTPIVADAMARLLAHVLQDSPEYRRAPAESRRALHRRRVEQFCRRNIASPTLNVAAISKGVGLSPAHLHRLFADEPLTLMAWLSAERLEAVHAAIRAGSGRQNLSQLAFSLGFKDAAHFSRVFKRRFGVCPRELLGRPSDDAAVAG